MGEAELLRYIGELEAIRAESVDLLGLLEAYRREVREMRVAILSLIEVWDHSQFFTTPEHVRQVKPRIDILRENWGFDVIREDQDGAPLSDQPTDWLDAEPDDR